jgi:hypothetical protein
VSTSDPDRTAIVLIDDRGVVTVVGSVGLGPDADPSQDRTYQVGVRYEFDP